MVPHVDIIHSVVPQSVSSIDQTVTIEITLTGQGGRVEDLPAAVLARLPRIPLQVVLVLDKSGSMGQSDYPPSRIEAAKAAAASFVSQLQPGDYVGLVTFETSADLATPLTRDHQETIDDLDRVFADGGTAMGDGLLIVLDHLEEFTDDGVKAIVLLSDGVSNEGVEPLLVAEDAALQGVPVFTVGIGTSEEEFDEPTLEGIANITGGEYLYAPDEEELQQVYLNMGGKVLNIAGLDVSLEITPSELFAIDDMTEDGLATGSLADSLLYSYDVLPVGEERTVQLIGRPLLNLPGQDIPLVSSIILRYTDLSTDIERINVGEPVKISFEGLVTGGDFRIDALTLERTLTDYPESSVYRMGKSVRALVELDKPRGTDAVSIVSLFNQAGAGNTDTQIATRSDVTHRLDHAEVAGAYELVSSVYLQNGELSDFVTEEFYVVFSAPQMWEEFANSTTFFGDKNISKLRFTNQVTLNPRSSRILENAAELLDLPLSQQSSLLSKFPGGVDNPSEAGEVLALTLWPNMLTYNSSQFGLGSDFGSNFDILDAGQGDDTDFTALYISLARSLNIPARGVRLNFKYDTDGTEIDGRDAFAEVYDDDTWWHADPTWPRWDDPDMYLRGQDGYFDIEASVESAPRKDTDDPLTTIKYAVGLISPAPSDVLYLDLEEGNEFTEKLYFVNQSKGTEARRLKVDVVDNGQLEIE